MRGWAQESLLRSEAPKPQASHVSWTQQSKGKVCFSGSGTLLYVVGDFLDILKTMYSE